MAIPKLPRVDPTNSMYILAKRKYIPVNTETGAYEVVLYGRRIKLGESLAKLKR